MSNLQVRNASDVTSFGVRLNQVASDRIVFAAPDTGNLVPTYNDRGEPFLLTPSSRG